EPAAVGDRGALQRAVADDAGAEQRGEFDVVVSVGQRQGEGRRYGDELGVPAVLVPSGVSRIRTEVLVAPATVAALPAGRAQPGHAHAVADGKALDRLPRPMDHTDHLVPRDDTHPVDGEITLR